MILFLLEILETAETGTQFTAELVAKHLKHCVIRFEDNQNVYLQKKLNLKSFTTATGI